jgi:hypothetical protein
MQPAGPVKLCSLKVTRHRFKIYYRKEFDLKIHNYIYVS